MPVRDAGKMLVTAIRSVERQSWRDYEVVAVDDGSRDGSAERLDAWARRDDRVRILHRSAEGLVPALNAGLEACRAPLVARMDADDAMLPRRLELQVAALAASPDLAGIGGAVRCFPRHRVAEGFRRYEGWLNRLSTPQDHLRERFVESPVVHPSMTLRRDVLEAAGGYHDVDWAEDYDLWLRLLEAGHRLAKLDAVLHFWRERPDRQTRVDPRYGKDRFLACKAHFLARDPCRGVGQVLIWGAGPTGRKLARGLIAEGVQPAAFLEIDAKKLGHRHAGIAVCPIDELEALRRAGPSTLVLVAVARRGAKTLIQPWLESRGWSEGRDYLAVAAGWMDAPRRSQSAGRSTSAFAEICVIPEA